jgi:hypothetical protein
MWSCPITPFEHRPNVPIRAGDKQFRGASHAQGLA